MPRLNPRTPQPTASPPEPSPPEPAPPDPVQAAVQVAAEDPELEVRVDDPGYRVFGSMAGGVRNLMSMIRAEDPGDPAVAARACTGIAERAVEVLIAAIERGALPGVVAAEAVERRSVPERSGWLTPYHTAVLLTLSSGAKVVLDWHATLDVDAPRRTTLEEL